MAPCGAVIRTAAVWHPDPGRIRTNAIHCGVNDVTDARPDPSEEVNGEDVEAIQNDESLTAADRVDLIANQVVAEEANGDTQNQG